MSISVSVKGFPVEVFEAAYKLGSPRTVHNKEPVLVSVGTGVKVSHEEMMDSVWSLTAGVSLEHVFNALQVKSYLQSLCSASDPVMTATSQDGRGFKLVTTVSELALPSIAQDREGRRILMSCDVQLVTDVLIVAVLIPQTYF